MNAIDFVVRNNAGMVERDVIQAGVETTMLQMTSGAEYSFNISQGSVQSYQRVGEDLQMTLADGRVIVLQDYFANFAEEPRLFVSSEGVLHEVFFAEGENGLLYAEYGKSAEWGKWSPDDQLIHYERAEISPVAYDGDENEVSMLGAGLLAGSGLWGLGAAGAAAGIAVLGPEDDPDNDDDNDTPATPTVDTTPIVIGGDGATQSFDVTGTGVPGDTVEVTVGGEVVQTVIGGDGTWKATFTGGDFPVDGAYDASVTVTTGGGAVVLDGPDVTIDLTPPVMDVSQGVIEVGDQLNAAGQAQGLTLTGTGEAGTTVTVTIGAYSHDALVQADGSWSATFLSSEVETGDYTRTVTLRSEDSYGNSSTITRTIDVDTEVSVGLNSTAVGGADNVVNGAEQSSAVMITGSADAGSSVVLTVAGTAYPAVIANASGQWSVTLPAGTLPTGETSVAMSVVATDDAGNSTSDSGTIQIDTLVNSLSMTSTPGGADGVINAVESQNGVTLSGMVEPGSTLNVTMGSVTRAATVAANGSWSVDFSAADVPQGDLQSVSVTLSAQDAAGNQRTENASIQVDTSAGYLTIDGAPIEGDDIINAIEARDGVAITGTATPNMLVTVTLGGASTQVMSNASGQWTANFTAGQIPADTDNAPITASITDAAGNTLNASDSVAVDTVVENQNIGNLSLGTDDIVNAFEAQQGVVVTGTTETGAQAIQITIDGTVYPGTLNSVAGTWSVVVPQSAFRANDEYNTQVIVESTDAAGNVDQISETIRVDTWVNSLSLSADSGTADGVVSASELANAGLALSGQVEAGSSLNVVFNNKTYAANVASNGAWTLTIPGNEVPGGDNYSAPMSLRATDAAGNVRTTNGSVMIDTVAPEGPQVEFVLEAPTGVAGIFVGAQTDTQAIYEVDASGNIGSVSHGTPTDAGAQTIYTFNNTVPDGSHLVVTSSDAAGNTRGTLLVLEDGAAGSGVNVSNANLGAMNVDTIQLEFAEDSELTLTEADIVALSSETNTVMVTGGSDDQVNIAGASRGATTTQDGQTFVEYTLGEATILVDSDITNVVI
ncbi:beta strand repeat-containing protein [Roseobacteraceae bacterium S113]